MKKEKKKGYFSTPSSGKLQNLCLGYAMCVLILGTTFIDILNDYPLNS